MPTIKIVPWSPPAHKITFAQIPIGHVFQLRGREVYFIKSGHTYVTRYDREVVRGDVSWFADVRDDIIYLGCPQFPSGGFIPDDNLLPKPLRPEDLPDNVIYVAADDSVCISKNGSYTSHLRLFNYTQIRFGLPVDGVVKQIVGRLVFE